jgi:hypothetical protein
MTIGWRSLDESDIDGHKTATDEVRDLRQKNGGVIGNSLIDCVSRIVRNEESVMPEIGFVPFLRVRSKAKGPDVKDLGIIKSGGVRLDITDQGLDKILGLAAPCPDEYSVPSMDVTEYSFL